LKYAHSVLNLFARIKQPQNDEQGHHRRNKISVCNFPGTAMMAAVAAAFFDNDDGRFCGHRV